MTKSVSERIGERILKQLSVGELSEPFNTRDAVSLFYNDIDYSETRDALWFSRVYNSLCYLCDIKKLDRSIKINEKGKLSNVLYKLKNDL